MLPVVTYGSRSKISYVIISSNLGIKLCFGKKRYKELHDALEQVVRRHLVLADDVQSLQHSPVEPPTLHGCSEFNVVWIQLQLRGAK